MEQFWQTAVSAAFSLDLKLVRLDGEFDLNFRGTAHDGQGYVVKVMRAGCDVELVEMQCGAMRAVANAGVPVPIVVPDISGADVAVINDAGGNARLVWVISLMDGDCYAKFLPKSLGLLRDLGEKTAMLGTALDGFSHPYLSRDFKWNLLQAHWISSQLDAVDDAARRAILDDIVVQFDAVIEQVKAFPQSAIHNDLNDYNVLAAATFDHAPYISGIIDFGDMVLGPRVVELATAAAYAVLDRDDPIDALSALVAGYNSYSALTEAELDLIYPLLRMRLAVSVVNSTLMAVENPDDPYVTVSQASAWRFLELDLDSEFISVKLRAACGLPVVQSAERVAAFLDAKRGTFAPLFGCDLADAPLGDLSVNGSVAPRNPFDLGPREAAAIGTDIKAEYWIGKYGEPRLIYTSDAFRTGQYKASNRRSIHLAVDVFAKAGHQMFAPLDGVVAVVENRDWHLDYGGVVILRHVTPEGDQFYTLYGHLDPAVVGDLTVGQAVNAGDAFCRLGTPAQNGGWAPHVHFQLAISIAGMGDDWPGVADPDQMEVWGAMCPNPAALLNLADDHVAYHPIDSDKILYERRAHFGENVKLSYEKPVMFLRGWKHHLFDEMGRTYLDAYNNVPHVGHAHPRIQAVAADQLMRMNSNTRYLHPAQVTFSEQVLATMPAELSVCYFVNSGSEANELALRLARAHSGGYDIVTPDHGYHGNTNAAIAMSAYKFNKPNGVGQADWVHLVDVADDYRGRYGRDDPDRGAKFAAQVGDAISAVDGKLAGFIAETFPSVGGQIIPPKGYLVGVYEYVRAAGGVCIADEVQTGLGRLGDYFYGFEQQGVVPDIVVLGKPIGNGHPIGVVVTTPKIAANFANGIEYFSTFGGSTLSCLMGAEVMKIVADEGLQENARVVGNQLLDGLRALQARHCAIGDVRGMGLFIGVELVCGGGNAPATALARFVINRMRDRRILIGAEGPDDNILKIRPPMTIEAQDAVQILETLDACLSEAVFLERVD
jgi:4-aminobutyrate aminotransferase-like enzyme/Ser/Thr protein kinase RdoA (MazF antagonist)